MIRIHIKWQYTKTPHNYSKERYNQTEYDDNYIIDTPVAEDGIDQGSVNDTPEPDENSEDQIAQNAQELATEGNSTRPTRNSRPPKRFGDYVLY